MAWGSISNILYRGLFNKKQSKDLNNTSTTRQVELNFKLTPAWISRAWTSSLQLQAWVTESSTRSDSLRVTRRVYGGSRVLPALSESAKVALSESASRCHTGSAGLLLVDWSRHCHASAVCFGWGLVTTWNGLAQLLILHLCSQLPTGLGDMKILSKGPGPRIGVRKFWFGSWLLWPLSAMESKVYS